MTQIEDEEIAVHKHVELGNQECNIDYQTLKYTQENSLHWPYIATLNMKLGLWIGLRPARN